jgi:hypothetical protein
MTNTTSQIPSTTETNQFKMFAGDFARLESTEKELVINELIAYSLKYSAMLKGGALAGDFDGSIMSINFDRYISGLYIEELGEVIKQFIIKCSE